MRSPTRVGSWAVAGLASLLLLSSRTVAAQSYCVPSRVWVELEVSGDAWLPEVADAVVGDLRARLNGEGIALCTPRDARVGDPTVAVVLEGQGSTVRFAASAEVAEVQLARALDLESYPVDARAVAVASYVYEALRSNWGALLAISAPIQQTPDTRGEVVDAPSERAVEEPPGSSAPPSTDEPASPATPSRLGVVMDGAFGWYSSQSSWFDGALSLRIRPFAYLELEAGIDGGGALAEDTAFGRVDAQRLGGHLTAALTPMSAREPVRVFLAARYEMAAVWLSGSRDGETVHASPEPVAGLLLGLEGWFAVAPLLDLHVAAYLGGVLLGAEGVAQYPDGRTETAAGIADLSLVVRLGLAVWP